MSLEQFWTISDFLFKYTKDQPIVIPYYVGLVLRYEKVSKKGLHKYPAFFKLIFKRKKI